MRLRTTIKIATITSVILLCIGIVVFFYFKITEVGKSKNFDLYKVVPSTAVAIVDSDNMVDLLTRINALHCNKDNNLHSISLLLSQIKDHIHTLLNETPHGFSKQMSKTLISFHEPDNNRNQVFYCRLGAGDKELVNKFIRKYCESSFPSKYFEYKGEEIRIYTMPDNTFLACYFHTDFFAVSYQKKLIEQVIDSKLSGISILNDPGFNPTPVVGRNQHPAIVHIKMQLLDWGNSSKKYEPGGWSEFGLKLNDDMIYLAGVTHDQDSTATFMNALKNQQPVKNFPGDLLPASTFYFSSHPISDIKSVLAISNQEESQYVATKNQQLLSFLDRYTGHSATTCMFESFDSLHYQPCVVTNIPITAAAEAERSFRFIAPVNGVYYSSLGNYHNISILSDRTLLSQFTELAHPAHFSFICFYNGSMLVAPDTKSIVSYIEDIDNGKTLTPNVMYEEARSSLSDSYNFLMMTDLAQVKKHLMKYLKWVPNFFFRNQNLFDNFILTSQYTCVNNMIYPNIVLLYKGSMKDVEVSETYSQANRKGVCSLFRNSVPSLFQL